MEINVDYLGVDYPCDITLYGKKYSSAWEALKAMKDLYRSYGKDFEKVKDYVLHEIQLCKFRQNEELGIMLMVTEDAEVSRIGGYNLLRVKNSLLIGMMNSNDDNTETRKAHLRTVAGNTIEIDILGNKMQYPMDAFRVACAFMQMAVEEYKYFSNWEGDITFKRHLMSEAEFIEALADLQEVYAEDDQEMLGWLSKDLVRYYLRDIGNQDAAEALIYNGF